MSKLSTRKTQNTYSFLLCCCYCYSISIIINMHPKIKGGQIPRHEIGTRGVDTERGCIDTRHTAIVGRPRSRPTQPSRPSRFASCAGGETALSPSLWFAHADQRMSFLPVQFLDGAYSFCRISGDVNMTAMKWCGYLRLPHVYVCCTCAGSFRRGKIGCEAVPKSMRP